MIFHESLIDKKAEMAVIGSCFLGGYPTFYEVREILDSHDFYSEHLRLIYETIIDLVEAQKPIDSIEVESATSGKFNGKQFVELINSVVTADNAKYYANIVKTKSMSREKITQMRQINEMLNNGDDPAEVIGKAINDDIRILSNRKKSDATRLEDSYDKFLRTVELRRAAGGIVGIKSGYSEFDRLTSGFRNGKFYIIGARPKMGKTTLALNMIYNIAKVLDRPIYFKTLEMSEEDISEKFANMITGIDSFAIQNSGMLSETEYNMVKGVSKTLRNTNIFIDDKPGKASEFCNSLRRWKAMNNLGFAVVDYLQCFGFEKNQSRFEQNTQVSNMMRDIAKELDIPVLGLSQLSRSVEDRDDKVPNASDLRESGAYEQDAAMVALMYRDDYYYPENYPKHNDPSEVDFIIPLNRFGPAGKIGFMFNKKQSRFYLEGVTP